MRGTFVFCVFIGVAMCLTDDLAEKLADLLSVTRTDAQICMNKTNVKVEDLMKIDELINDNVETMDIDRSVLKVGCLFACLFQRKELMSGTHIDLNRLKEMSNAKIRLNDYHKIIRDRALNTCHDRVKSKTNECEIIVKFFLCTVKEIKKAFRNMRKR